MSTTDGINKSIEFSLDELVIVGASGVSADLREVMREMNIFEDLFSNTMSGSLFVSDAQNLINLLPIVGAEYLAVTFSKPSTPWKLRKVFRVYKITDRRKNSHASEDYMLHFCSEESILSESVRISKAYKGMTVSEIIKDITVSFLKIDKAKFPSSELTSTVGNFNIVIPNWNPFYTINWLARMARTGDTPGCSFVFFEDSEGFHFRSIESMTQQTPLQSINFSPVNFSGERTDTPDIQVRLESAEDYALTGAPDLLRSISTGVYGGRLITVNPLSQKITTSSVNSAVLFNQTHHLNDHPFIQLNQSRLDLPQTEQYDSNFRISADNLNVDTWMIQRNTYLASMHGFQVKVSVPGNMYLRVGQVVTLNLPAAVAPSKESKPMDRLFGGKYLITAIRHKIDRTKYVCILELSKDSLTEPLPIPITTSPGLRRLRQS